MVSSLANKTQRLLFAICTEMPPACTVETIDLSRLVYISLSLVHFLEMFLWFLDFLFIYSPPLEVVSRSRSMRSRGALSRLIILETLPLPLVSSLKLHLPRSIDRVWRLTKEETI
jgi:hypothetical protein